MKKLMIGVVMLALSGVAHAGFTCEQINDKKVRNSCIADRDTEIDKAVGDFVQKAKNDLTRGFKDPASVEFTELVVSEDATRTALCGKVNGKNAYGGYTGRKMFYVEYYKSAAMERFNPAIWIEGASLNDELNSPDQDVRGAAIKVVASELTLARAICDPSVTNEVTKVDNSPK